MKVAPGIYPPLATATDVNNNVLVHTKTLRTKMMIFNSFITTKDYNFGCNWLNGLHVFLPTNKAFEGICLALVRTFIQNELCILFVFETIL